MRFHNMLNRYIYSLMSLMFYQPHAYVPATGNTMANTGATALQKAMWDATLREDTTLDDIFNRLRDSVDSTGRSTIEVPDTIMMQVPTAPTGTHKMILGMTTPLKKAPQEGNAEFMLGNEEQLELLSLTLYYNEVKKSVAQRGWGIDYNDINGTGLYGTINPKFTKYWMELRGRRIREASMLTFSSELTKAPVSMKQQFNSNIFIPNLALGSMPVWDVTDLTNTAGAVDSDGYYSSRTFSGASTYIESIADKMLTASGTASTSKAYMNIENLNDLDLFLRTRLKMPMLTIGKGRGYVYVCPVDVVAYLTDPTRSGSMGALWKDITKLTAEEASYPGMIGKYKSLYIVEDERAATLTVGGSQGSYTLKPGFVQPGNNDDRNLLPWSATSGSLNYVFEVGMVYGQGSLAEWIVSDVQYAKESTEYGQLLGKGSYMCGGIQLVRYDKDTGDDANNSNSTGLGKTLIQRSSCMVLTSRITGSTLR